MTALEVRTLRSSPSQFGEAPGLFLVAVAVGHFLASRKPLKVDGPIDIDLRITSSVLEVAIRVAAPREDLKGLFLRR